MGGISERYVGLKSEEIDGFWGYDLAWRWDESSSWSILGGIYKVTINDLYVRLLGQRPRDIGEYSTVLQRRLNGTLSMLT